MKSYTENLHNELLSKLDELDRNYDPRLLTDTRLELVVNTIEKIKQKLTTYPFHSEEEEIHYFKSVLPETLFLHIYYADRIEWDRIRHQGSQACRYTFTDKVYSQAENFRGTNKEFYEYYRDGQTHLDNYYFLRNSPCNRENTYPLRPIIDPKSPPIHCALIAKLLAYARIEQEMHLSISENREKTIPEKSFRSRLKWTDKTICLVEIGYALKEQGSFNNGNASLKDIFGFFEEAFEVDLRNPPRQFQDILARKTGNTNFLDLLAEKLQKRIEGIENEHLR